MAEGLRGYARTGKGRTKHIVEIAYSAAGKPRVARALCVYQPSRWYPPDFERPHASYLCPRCKAVEVKSDG